jgi:hypothetical protein
MPTLLNVLSSNDPKVVEQGCLCVSRIVESFKKELRVDMGSNQIRRSWQ